LTVSPGCSRGYGPNPESAHVSLKNGDARDGHRSRSAPAVEPAVSGRGGGGQLLSRMHRGVPEPVMDCLPGSARPASNAAPRRERGNCPAESVAGITRPIRWESPGSIGITCDAPSGRGHHRLCPLSRRAANDSRFPCIAAPHRSTVIYVLEGSPGNARKSTVARGTARGGMRTAIQPMQDGNRSILRFLSSGHRPRSSLASRLHRASSTGDRPIRFWFPFHQGTRLLEWVSQKRSNAGTAKMSGLRPDHVSRGAARMANA
jgi:hypothetical protein